MNEGKVSDLASKKEWQWVFNNDVEIENYCIKCGTIYEDYLLIFARGRPRDTVEECISMVLIYKLKVANNKVTGIDPEYHFYKLDPLVNPEFLMSPKVSRRDNDLVIRFVQEGNYSDSFPT